MDNSIKNILIQEFPYTGVLTVAETEKKKISITTVKVGKLWEKKLRLNGGLRNVLS